MKFFLAGMFFFGIHINTAYKSYLINVLTTPRNEEQINTVEKAIEAKLIFQLNENVVELLNEKKDPVNVKKNLSKF